MQLIYFCILLSAFVGSLLDELLGCAASDFCVSWCLGLVAVMGVWGKYAASRARHRIHLARSGRVHLFSYEKQHYCILWFWIAFAPLYLAAIGWGEYGKTLVPLADSLAWKFAWWCFPTILVLTLLDAARYQLYRSAGHKLSGGARHAWLVTIVPCLTSCILWDTATFLSDFIAGSARPSPMVTAFLLSTLMAAVLPFLMTMLWTTEKLSDDSRSQMLRRTWVHAGGDPRAIRLWKTDSSIANAMVIGWCRPFRFLLISDLLLEKLAPDELRMIVLHEAAHCRRWHSWLRLLPVWTMTIPIVASHNHDFMLQTFGGLPWANPLAQPILILFSIFWMCLLLSWIARWTEFDADRIAVELAGYQRSMIAQQSAARVLIRALRKLTPTALVGKESWLHPSLDRRIKSLNQQYFMEQSRLVESLDDNGCFSSPP